MLPPNSIPNQIYGYLKESILLNEIEAGEHLIESRLSKFFGVSRTPIREAFRRLEQDSLIERLPRGGVCVAHLNEGTLKEVLDIRLILEGYAAELTCKNITPEELHQLKGIIDRAEVFMSSSDTSSREKIHEIWKLNILFHDTILHATKNEQLIKILGYLRDTVQRFRILSHFDPESRMKSWREHKLMIECLEKKDKNALKMVWRQHLKDAAATAFKTIASRKRA
jgi:DNA-binding GntR family transcriptional regulator